MSSYVVDASVAVKWLVDEAHSEEAAKLLDHGAPLVAPELVFAESANALWAMHRRGDIDANELAEAVDALRAAPILVPRPMRALTAAASRLARDLNHPVYDCFYLALALELQYPVVTADQAFQNKVDAHPYLSHHIMHVAQATSHNA